MTIKLQKAIEAIYWESGVRKYSIGRMVSFKLFGYGVIIFRRNISICKLV